MSLRIHRVWTRQSHSTLANYHWKQAIQLRAVRYWPMSALGHKQTPALQKGVSALPRIATAKADSRKIHVCFTPESRHVQCGSACPLWANSGHQIQFLAQETMRGAYLLPAYRFNHGPRLAPSASPFDLPQPVARARSYKSACRWSQRTGMAACSSRPPGCGCPSRCRETRRAP